MGIQYYPGGPDESLEDTSHKGQKEHESVTQSESVAFARSHSIKKGIAVKIDRKWVRVSLIVSNSRTRSDKRANQSRQRQQEKVSSGQQQARNLRETRLSRRHRDSKAQMTRDKYRRDPCHNVAC